MKFDKDDLAGARAGIRPRIKKKHKAAARQRVEPRKTLMKAAAIDRFGPPSVFKLRALPLPVPGLDEVLIELHAAGVGVWDADIRGGWWPEGRPKFPLVLGTDGAGTIAAVGSRVRRFRKNDHVWGYEFINPKGGCYAEYVVMNADHVGRIPPRLDLLHAAAATVTGLTALQGIDDHLRVRRGETVLIYGASGAVGTLAIQFAKNCGARVLGTASGRDAATLVRKLGADGVIDARKERGLEQIKALAPDGIDAVLACAGGDGLERCLDFVCTGGRVAYPNGVDPEPKKRRNLKILSYDAAAGRREFDRLASAFKSAKVKVPIAAVFPLMQAARAHERIEKGHLLGRIALKIR